MILIHLLLVLLVLVALVLQLITPLVLNIPIMAFCLLILILTVWSFRRARRNKKVPVVASLALGLQSLLFLLSIAILAVVTIPNEAPDDSPAVVQGIRRFLVSQGIIEKPRTIAPPMVSPSGEKKAPESLNAPEATQIQIKIDDEPAGKPAAATGSSEENQPPKPEEKKATP